MIEKKVIEALLIYGFSRRYIKKLIRREREKRKAVLRERRKEKKESIVKKLLRDMY
jgi:hypothetical protein